MDVATENETIRQPDAPRAMRGRLFFRKYAVSFAAVVCLALVANGLLDISFSYQEQKTLLVRIQRGEANAAAANISQFMKEIESQMAWATLLSWDSTAWKEWRFDAVRMLRQVPAITELMQLDADGRELFRMSRQAKDVIASRADHSRDPLFAEAMSKKILRTGLLCGRVQTLHHARPRGDPAGSWHHCWPSEPQIYLGRRVANQGWRTWTSVCGQFSGTAHRAS